jgi:ABC-type nitrate/sulfonate/bicarbonate transport system substrate-binding protein
MADDNHPETVDKLMVRVRKSHAAIRRHREAMAAAARQAADNNDNAQREGVNNQ